MVLWSEKMLDKISVFFNDWALLCGPVCDLFKRMDMCALKEKHVHLLLYKLSLSCIMCHLKPVLTDVLSG